jgi:hypothetical protein
MTDVNFLTVSLSGRNAFTGQNASRTIGNKFAFLFEFNEHIQINATGLGNTLNLDAPNLVGGFGAFNTETLTMPSATSSGLIVFSNSTSPPGIGNPPWVDYCLNLPFLSE